MNNATDSNSKERAQEEEPGIQDFTKKRTNSSVELKRELNINASIFS
jgi:hypothetical protein